MTEALLRRGGDPITRRDSVHASAYRCLLAAFDEFVAVFTRVTIIPNMPDLLHPPPRHETDRKLRERSF